MSDSRGRGPPGPGNKDDEREVGAAPTRMLEDDTTVAETRQLPMPPLLPVGDAKTLVDKADPTTDEVEVSKALERALKRLRAPADETPRGELEEVLVDAFNEIYRELEAASPTPARKNEGSTVPQARLPSNDSH